MKASLLKRIIKRFLHIDAVLNTLAVFAVIGIFGLLPLNSEFINPLADAISDFEITDIVYSKLKSHEDAKADTNVVIVNIGFLDRRGIAYLVNALNSFEPKAIGIDAFFRLPKTPEGDSLLAQAIANTPNMVLVSQVNRYNTQQKYWDTLETSHPMFNQNVKTGLSNLITDSEGNDRFRVCRTFSPKEQLENRVEYAFAVELAKFIDPEKTEKFLKRNKTIELINFERNIPTGYPVYDFSEIFNPDLHQYVAPTIKGKVVLLGFLGEKLGSRSWEDKFYTPLNEQFAGRAVPDMFGVVIHANIISMIVNQSVVNNMPQIVAILLAILLLHINVVYFLYIKQNYPKWYDAATKTIQLIETIIIIYFVLQVLARFRYYINVELAIVALVLSGDLLEIISEGVTFIRVFVYTKTKQMFNFKRKSVEKNEED